ncbi:MAG TPA: hypothetical protein ENN23_04590 [Deltaproteobacteria bacterium]|nr:hypothetical protein [Deltaproteobacteria bacterium]
MPIQDKCPNPDCRWQYDVHDELKKNLNPQEKHEAHKKMLCPLCQQEIASRLCVCPGCHYIVAGKRTFRKSSLFLAVCLVLIMLSLIFKYSG